MPNPSVIRHEASATFVDVTANVSGRSVEAVANDVDIAVAAIQFPLEHHAEVLGGFADDRAAQTRVLAATVAALVLIYLLLQAAFASWKLATIAFLALPLAVSGSLLAVAITGGDLRLGSVAGIVGVFALAVRWVLIAITGYQRRERRNEPFGKELVIGESAQLIVPIAISAITIAVVFLPMAIGGSRPGLEIVGPMAIAILGGLITTLLLAGAVIPAAYLRWGHIAEPDRSADDLFTAHEVVAMPTGGRT